MIGIDVSSICSSATSFTARGFSVTSFTGRGSYIIGRAANEVDVPDSCLIGVAAGGVICLTLTLAVF